MLIPAATPSTRHCASNRQSDLSTLSCSTSRLIAAAPGIPTKTFSRHVPPLQRCKGRVGTLNASPVLDAPRRLKYPLMQMMMRIDMRNKTCHEEIRVASDNVRHLLIGSVFLESLQKTRIRSACNEANQEPKAPSWNSVVVCKAHGWAIGKSAIFAVASELRAFFLLPDQKRLGYAATLTRDPRSATPREPSDLASSSMRRPKDAQFGARRLVGPTGLVIGCPS
ncbi:hypothetical protein CSOJ01_05233 [Colletotrichum sojae]|uniref:Uncharacterized protein n=1 Tax=Colletotrichum sojae TaxID=2175907 RepID=A0A8H6JFI9_9PEZI|nr:hypothetical protein CSOJ01_05233 [Colletotrichum sojae]